MVYELIEYVLINGKCINGKWFYLMVFVLMEYECLLWLSTEVANGLCIN